jgi:hypothetical protein
VCAGAEEKGRETGERTQQESTVGRPAGLRGLPRVTRSPGCAAPPPYPPPPYNRGAAVVLRTIGLLDSSAGKAPGRGASLRRRRRHSRSSLAATLFRDQLDYLYISR